MFFKAHVVLEKLTMIHDVISNLQLEIKFTFIMETT